MTFEVTPSLFVYALYIKPDASHEMSDLPIREYEEKLVKAVNNSDCTVITGETGCGKTTQFPQFLHKAGYTKHGVVGVSQPRRVAAISVARYVAKELDISLGGKVGYQVRFDDCTSRDTVIKYVTDGCLLRELLEDRNLCKYSVLILDEAHERSLATDILFGLVKELLRKNRKLKVVIMSATLNTEKFSSFFNNCPVFRIPGRLYPVQVNYLFTDDRFDDSRLCYMQHVVTQVMDIHFEQAEGDILVFLTGQWEIENVCDRLFKAAEVIDYEHDIVCKAVQGLMILPLYGAMATDQQQKVFAPVEGGVRRVIVATNIAATSITINGVVYVVDCGYIKQTTYNPRTGLDCLEVVPISQSEAKQRSGRAGRTQPGQCIRLYSKKFYDSMLDSAVPEIQRASLTNVMLSLKCMGIKNVLHFDYLDPPSEKMILEALKQLYHYQAVDIDGRVTVLGHQLVQYPLQPSLARAVIRSRQLGCSETLLPIIAMLSVENTLIKPAGNKKLVEEADQAHKNLKEIGGGNNDFATLLTTYKLCHDSNIPQEWCKRNFVHWRSMKTAKSILEQVKAILDGQQIPFDSSSDASLGKLVRQSLCYGLYTHVARKGSSGHSFRTMDGHSTTVYLHPSSALFGKDNRLDWVLFNELLDTGKTYMHCICPIKYSWVQDLLPLMHEVDVYRLTECKQETIRSTSSISDIGEDGPVAKRPRKASVEVMVTVQEKEDKLAAARERYLSRKKANVKK